MQEESLQPLSIATAFQNTKTTAMRRNHFVNLLSKWY